MLGVVASSRWGDAEDATGADRPAEMTQSTIELAYRESGGLRVALLWSKGDPTLKVTVFDTSTDDSFELEAVENQALDVFYHPYAYAGSRGAGRN